MPLRVILAVELLVMLDVGVTDEVGLGLAKRDSVAVALAVWLPVLVAVPV